MTSPTTERTSVNGPLTGPETAPRRGWDRPDSRQRHRRRRESRWALVFLAPTILIVGVFVAYPILSAGYLSTFSWNGTGPRTFVGLDNYRRLVTDGVFWHALANNGLIALSAVVAQIMVGLVLAYCLVRIVPQVKRIYMFCYMVPVVISEICIGLLWSFVYNPAFGLLNGFLKALGLNSWRHGWLGDASTAFPAVLVVMSFTYLGLYVLLFVSAMQHVPEDRYEAATLDGCGSVRMFFSITLPSVRDSIQSTTLLAVITSFKTFSLVYVLTNGGPNHATEVVSTLLYKTGFITFDQGYAATIGFAQMILTALAGLLVFRVLRRAPRRARAAVAE
jgi:raffinose/stachyose/melibiose transport system permease protein